MTNGWRLANQRAVPFTGVRAHGHWWRRPRHVAVLRAAVDGGLRAGTVPPTDHDDLSIAALSSRNWKRHRRTQYRSAQ